MPGPEGSPARVTLTRALLETARRVLFLVSGPVKAWALARVASGDPLPAGRIRPPGAGRLVWLIERRAACLLPTGGASG